MKFAQWLIGLCCTAWLTCAMGDNLACGERHIVLVSGSQSSVQQLSSTEARKLFMGFPVSQRGQYIVPVLNLSETLLYEVFLQKVVFMSASSYERRVMSRTFRQGDARPLEMTTQRTLSETLHTNPVAVSFMWKEDANGKPDLKVVQEPCRNLEQ